jgi:ParB/RepB/Spo0J family partition protein
MTGATSLILALTSGEDLAWHDRALCAQTDPEAFFPEKGGSTREAKKVCRGCEVRGECLEYALEHGERFGIWGGMSERERRRLNRESCSAGPSMHEPGDTPVNGQTFVHISRVHSHPGNIRKVLSDLPEMAASIRACGILQPLIVEPHPSKPGHFQLVAGDRRLGGARLARQEQIPVIIRPPSGPGRPVEELMLVENCQRRDLNPVEKAEAMGALVRKGYTAARIAQRTGLSSSTISYYLALLDLDQASREKIRAGQLSAADAVTGIRETRKRARKRRGTPAVGAVWEPDHFSGSHPLARKARGMCDGLGHTMRRRIGRTACGHCWETVIREDEKATATTLRSVS